MRAKSRLNRNFNCNFYGTVFDILSVVYKIDFILLLHSYFFIIPSVLYFYLVIFYFRSSHESFSAFHDFVFD